jgi:hypothetical protein
MKPFHVVAPLWLLVGAVTADATDLTKLDRSIRREPAYSGKPGYCLLVFGPKAEHRVWLVLDRDSLYVDRNGNGDLTEEGERIPLGKWTPAKPHTAHSLERRVQAGDLHVGGLRHTDLVLLQTQHHRKIDPAAANAAAWQTHVDEVWRETGHGVTLLISLNLDAACYEWFKAPKGLKINHCSGDKGRLAFAATPAAAPVLHFGGPLTFNLASTELRRGKEGQKLVLHLGTMGLGRGAFVMAGLDLGPDNVDLDPVAEIEWPADRAGQPPLIQKLPIDERC